jgi:hypothetical protein
MAGDYEKMSKHFTGKDAITFFGETVSWEKEFEFVEASKNDFVKLVSKKEGKQLSRGILHRVILFKNTKDKGDISYKWNTAYYLKRYMQRYENDEAIRKFLKDLQEHLFAKNATRNYDLIALASRWAEMELKYFNK